MIRPHHKKIVIVGNAGSGKTTLALQLREKLDLPLYHLDQYYWKAGWQRVGFEKFSEIHVELCKQDAWIIEGSYVSVLYQRVISADVVIFLDIPRYWCIVNVIKRAVSNFGRTVAGSPEGCKQQLFSLKFLYFLKWVWGFNKRYRYVIIDILDEFKNISIAKDSDTQSEKQLYILKSLQEIEAFLQLTSDYWYS